MAFSVEITKAALADAEAYVNYIRANRGEAIAAEQWRNGLIDGILSLKRCREGVRSFQNRNTLNRKCGNSSTLLIESFSLSMRTP